MNDAQEATKGDAEEESSEESSDEEAEAQKKDPKLDEFTESEQEEEVSSTDGNPVDFAEEQAAHKKKEE